MHTNCHMTHTHTNTRPRGRVCFSFSLTACFTFVSTHTHTLIPTHTHTPPMDPIRWVKRVMVQRDAASRLKASSSSATTAARSTKGHACVLRTCPAPQGGGVEGWGGEMEQDLQHSLLQMKGTNNGSFIRSFSFHPITLQNAQQHLARSTNSSLEAQKFPFHPLLGGGGRGEGGLGFGLEETRESPSL